MAVGRPKRRRALPRSVVVIGEIMEGRKKQSAGGRQKWDFMDGIMVEARVAPRDNP